MKKFMFLFLISAGVFAQEAGEPGPAQEAAEPEIIPYVAPVPQAAPAAQEAAAVESPGGAQAAPAVPAAEVPAAEAPAPQEPAVTQEAPPPEWEPPAPAWDAPATDEYLAQNTGGDVAQEVEDYLNDPARLMTRLATLGVFDAFKNEQHAIVIYKPKSWTVKGKAADYIQTVLANLQVKPFYNNSGFPLIKPGSIDAHHHFSQKRNELGYLWVIFETPYSVVPVDILEYKTGNMKDDYEYLGMVTSDKQGNFDFMKGFLVRNPKEVLP